MEAEESDEADERVFYDFIEGMEGWARPFGLYLQHASGERRPLEEHVLVGVDPIVRPFVAARFVLGDEAFSERVQFPERYSDDALIKGMEHATYEAEAAEIMKRYLETGEVFGEDD